MKKVSFTSKCKNIAVQNDISLEYKYLKKIVINILGWLVHA